MLILSISQEIQEKDGWVFRREKYPKNYDGFSVLGLLLFIKKTTKSKLISKSYKCSKMDQHQQKKMMQAHISL
jgi:hypothetical protein